MNLYEIINKEKLEGKKVERASFFRHRSGLNTSSLIFIEVFINPFALSLSKGVLLLRWYEFLGLHRALC